MSTADKIAILLLFLFGLFVDYFLAILIALLWIIAILKSEKRERVSRKFTMMKYS